MSQKVHILNCGSPELIPPPFGLFPLFGTFFNLNASLRHGNGRFVFEVNGTQKINHFMQLVEVMMCKEVGTECGVDDMRSRRRRTVCPIANLAA